VARSLSAEFSQGSESSNFQQFHLFKVIKKLHTTIFGVSVHFKPPPVDEQGKLLIFKYILSNVR